MKSTNYDVMKAQGYCFVIAFILILAVVYFAVFHSNIPQ